MILLKTRGLTQDRFDIFIAFSRKLVDADGARAQCGPFERKFFVYARVDYSFDNGVERLELLRDLNHVQRETSFSLALAGRNSTDERKVQNDSRPWKLTKSEWIQGNVSLCLLWDIADIKLGEVVGRNWVTDVNARVAAGGSEDSG